MMEDIINEKFDDTTTTVVVVAPHNSSSSSAAAAGAPAGSSSSRNNQDDRSTPLIDQLQPPASVMSVCWSKFINKLGGLVLCVRSTSRDFSDWLCKWLVYLFYNPCCCICCCYFTIMILGWLLSGSRRCKKGHFEHTGTSFEDDTPSFHCSKYYDDDDD
jgi:hypothetical protein